MTMNSFGLHVLGNATGKSDLNPNGCYFDLSLSICVSVHSLNIDNFVRHIPHGITGIPGAGGRGETFGNRSLQFPADIGVVVCTVCTPFKISR